jgi:hypothetical protein
VRNVFHEFLVRIEKEYLLPAQSVIVPPGEAGKECDNSIVEMGKVGSAGISHISYHIPFADTLIFFRIEL